MAYQVISLLFLITAIVLGFTKKINVGIVSMGLAFILGLIGKKTFLIPIIIYLVSYILSAAGPGAISVQSVMIIFAVSLAVQMKASPILLGSMAILGAVGGTTSPIALSGIIVTDLTAEMGLTGVAILYSSV